MQMFSATLELEAPAEAMTGAAGDAMLARFEAFHVTLARSPLNRAQLTLTLPAETLWQATEMIRALTSGLTIASVLIEDPRDLDRRSGSAVPPLLSVTEVAERLGLTRTGVQHRIAAGALPAVRVGNTWAIPATAARAPDAAPPT